MAEFGSRFKAARDSRGISIEEVAQQTRISARFLRAIEEDAFGELPGGVFNRGFIRSYASVVGLDPDTMVEAYSSLNAEHPTVESSSAARNAPLRRERFVLPVAVGGLAVLVFLISIFSRSPVPTSEEAIGAPPPVTAASAALERSDRAEERPLAGLESGSTSGLNADRSGPGSEVNDEGNEAVENETSGHAGTGGRSEVRDTLAGPSPAEARVTGLPDQATLSSAETIPEREEPKPASETATDSATDLHVRLEVHDRTQLYVELDGEVLYEDIIINPPFWRVYTVSQALALRIADPGAVSLSINGEPVGELGPPDEAWEGTITPENIALLMGPGR